jgi:hypothetical protein
LDEEACRRLFPTHPYSKEQAAEEVSTRAVYPGQKGLVANQVNPVPDASHNEVTMAAQPEGELVSPSSSYQPDQEAHRTAERLQKVDWLFQQQLISAEERDRQRGDILRDV